MLLGRVVVDRCTADNDWAVAVSFAAIAAGQVMVHFGVRDFALATTNRNPAAVGAGLIVVNLALCNRECAVALESRRHFRPLRYCR